MTNDSFVSRVCPDVTHGAVVLSESSEVAGCVWKSYWGVTQSQALFVQACSVIGAPSIQFNARNIQSLYSLYKMYSVWLSGINVGKVMGADITINTNDHLSRHTHVARYETVHPSHILCIVDPSPSQLQGGGTRGWDGSAVREALASGPAFWHNASMELFKEREEGKKHPQKNW